MEFRVATAVQGIADELIQKHHSHLLGVRVQCLFLDKTPKSKGKEQWGRAKKISGLPAFLADDPDRLPNDYEDQPPDFFVIEISEEAWDGLKPRGRRALVDHELSHCEIETDDEGRVSLAIVDHDVTEFEAIIRRHGLWNDSVKEFVEAGAEQLTLDGAMDELPKPADDELQAGHTETFTFGPEHRDAIAEGARHLRDMGAKLSVGAPGGRSE